jgi:hypothetical protein
LWSNWPPPEPVHHAPPPPEPPVTNEVEAEPVGAQSEIVVEPVRENPPTVPSSPPVAAQRIVNISEPPPPEPALEARMRLAMASGDFAAARAFAERILADDPTDLDAHACLETCNQRLQAQYELRLGARDRVLCQSLPTDWLSDMELDPQVAFLLSRIDGSSTIEEILDVCGMRREDATRALVELLEEGVVEALPLPPRASSRPPRRR